MSSDQATPDMINSPPHYRGAGGIEAIDVIEAYGLGYHLGNAMKYLLRAGKKGDAVEDLRKAGWYMLRFREMSAETMEPNPVALIVRPIATVVRAFDLSPAVGIAVKNILDAAAHGGSRAEQHLKLALAFGFIANAAEAGA